MVMKIGKFRIGISWEISLSIPIGFAGNQLKQKNMGFLTLKFDDSSGVFTNSHHPIRREVRISGIKRDGTGKEDMDVANKIANLGILWGIIGFDGLISENLQSEITCCLGQVSTTANKSSGSS